MSGKYKHNFNKEFLTFQTFSLISSEVGYFTFDILEDFLVGACTYVIPPVFNSYFEKYGVPIPSFKGFSAVNPQIVYGNGYIGAYSSIQYTPPK